MVPMSGVTGTGGEGRPNRLGSSGTAYIPSTRSENGRQATSRLGDTSNWDRIGPPVSYKYL